MSLLEQIPCISIAFLTFGVLSLNGGIRILIRKKTTLIERNPSLQNWEKPVKIRGKQSKFWGLLYTISGFILIVFAVITFIGGV